MMLEEAAEVNGKMTGKTLIGPLVCVDFFPAGRKTPKDEKSTNANMNPVRTDAIPLTAKCDVFCA